ncbi:succinate dehydrogenase, cytochrome b556 subunit [Pseudodonghicola flavimaris]|uniref:Succinate dehydrogenase cytochrome b556 subunit n=1 Tax=Pseudodonghicola flavimaris TaxID=3050036 RepID=A0ABT7EXC5_9RHOB|nr:succinate dehydrogenase, cytochrome b556 subunit [Pseudodonghicola flavimaris]MDK3016934.1 succinate dehydrogenase, cytochrome b556 subunit [Pseudodonghicola flavimaris]
MADVNRGNRPLSPFMLGKYYRFQLNSVTSILNRITGNAMLVAALLIVWWFLAAATAPEYFAVVDWIVTSFIGDLVMFLSLWGIWYHLLAGIRHLIWENGVGLDMSTSDKMGWAAIIGSVLLTLITVAVI